MATPVAQALAYARAHRVRFLRELKRLCEFPSVSVQPAHAGDVRRTAEWLARHLREIGLERAQMAPTKRHPIVYAEWRRAPGRPTVLIYGHYDVQPADPLDEWKTPPFEPSVRGGNLHSRGASDDKGQMFTHVKALEAYLRTRRTLPVNVKCLFEGEEEIGSPNLTTFLKENRRALEADLAVMSDTRIAAPDRPALTYSLRGALGLEIEIRGAESDSHSGLFGGAIQNPIEAGQADGPSA
jgi:acetylornithine deacetylase/succinyl-diaminopimelate desuccinylase-like protein